MDDSYPSCCCSFLCSLFNMSQVPTTMAVTTTPVTVVCSSTSSLLNVTMTPTLIGLPATSSKHDMVLPPLLMPRDTRSVVGLATVLQQQPQSQMPLQDYANYSMVLCRYVFLSELSLPPISLYVLVSVLVYAFCFQVLSWMPYSLMSDQPLAFAPLQPFGPYPWKACLQPGDGY